MALYELDVPAVNPGALEGGESRYGCCHQTEAQGHAETCVPETRAAHIEKALERAGISFSRVRDEDKQPDEEPSLKRGELHVVTAGTQSGRMSAADPNESNGPKGRDKHEETLLEGYESPEMRKYGHPDPGLKSLHEVVTEPSVVAELRTAQASIQHALFRLGGIRD